MLDLTSTSATTATGSISVSDFGVQHLEGLKASGLPTPSVNQIEIHPWQQKKEIVKYCRENGITVMGYSPLARGHRLNDPKLEKIAQKYNKSAAQVLIRWSVQKGFITIPKSTKLDRIIENVGVFDWSMDEEDMNILKHRMVSKATNLSSKVVLNDGVEMPMFGLGMYLSASGQGEAAENTVIHAVQNGYRLIDTAQYYGNEADVGRGVKGSSADRKDLFIVTKEWENGAKRCKERVNERIKKLDLGYVDLFLIHSPIEGKNVDTYKTLLEFKSKGLIREEAIIYMYNKCAFFETSGLPNKREGCANVIRIIAPFAINVANRCTKSVGVANFGVQHLEGLKAAGLPKPSVNQFELHPWQQNKDVVKYCRENGITVMGYSPLTKGEKLNDPTLKNIAQRYSKSTAQVLIRWSVQKGFITIPKTSTSDRIIENADVFDWSIDEEDMNILDVMPDYSCWAWTPLAAPWKG